MDTEPQYQYPGIKGITLQEQTRDSSSWWTFCGIGYVPDGPGYAPGT